jgi:hypothetical protein
MNYMRYKDAVVKEVAKKHILLYNSVIDRTRAPLVRKINYS